MSDPLDTLGVQLDADHQEKKRRARKSGQTAEAEALAAGSPADEAEALGEVVDDSVQDALADLGDAIDARDADQDRATDFAVERFERIVEEATFERGTLVGDIRDTLLDLFKGNPKPWSLINEDGQRAIAAALTDCARKIVRGVIVIISDDDGPAIHAKLEGYAEKGGLKINCTATGNDETVLALHKAVGRNVIIRTADANRYDSERGEPSIMPDEPGLQFEGDDDQQRDPFTGPEGDDDLVDAADDLDQDRD